MKRSLLLPGRTPLARRPGAAFILDSTAIAVTVPIADGEPRGIGLALHLLAAPAALVFLNFRWGTGKRRSLTPRQIKDTSR